MQDKPWDEQFEDRAWSEMRQLLDRELPVVKERRKPWIWLALLCLLAGLTIGGWYWWQMPTGWDLPADKPVEISADGNSGQVVAGKSDRNAPSSVADGSSQKVAATENESALASADNTRPAPAMRKKYSQQRSPSSITSSAASLSNAEKPAEPQPLATATETVSPLTQPQLSGEVLSGEEGEEGIRQPIPIPVFSLLSTLKIEGLSAPENVAVLPVDELTSRTAFFLLPDELGLHSELSTGTAAFFGGGALGVTAGYRLGTSRWAVQSGLQYRYERLDFKRQNERLPAFAADQGSQPDSPGTAGQEDLGVSSPSSGVNNGQLPGNGRLGAVVHSLNLPVSLQYRLSTRFDLSGGVRLNYILAATGRSFNGDSAAERAVNFPDQDLARLLNTAAGQRFDRSLLHEFDIGLSVGVQYRLSPRWRLHLRYHHGLKDWLRSDYYQVHQRFVGFGATYLMK